MKKRNEFKMISESEIIFWAMNGLCEQLHQTASRAAYLREEGKQKQAEELREHFNRIRDQYLEIFRATYAKDAHELAQNVVDREAKFGWGVKK